MPPSRGPTGSEWPDRPACPGRAASRRAVAAEGLHSSTRHGKGWRAIVREGLGSKGSSWRRPPTGARTPRYPRSGSRRRPACISASSTCTAASGGASAASGWPSTRRPWRSPRARRRDSRSRARRRSGCGATSTRPQPISAWTRRSRSGSNGRYPRMPASDPARNSRCQWPQRWRGSIAKRSRRRRSLMSSIAETARASGCAPSPRAV